MSPLAETIYEVLRQQAMLAEPRITYRALAEALRERSDDFEHVTHRSQPMYAALGEVGEECRRLGLPCLPALVVRADSGRPGDAYFEGPTASGLRFKGEKIAAWRRELNAVRQTAYPSRARIEDRGWRMEDRG